MTRKRGKREELDEECVEEMSEKDRHDIIDSGEEKRGGRKGSNKTEERL